VVIAARAEEIVAGNPLPVRNLDPKQLQRRAGKGSPFLLQT